MTKLPLFIDDVNYTSYIDKYGYQVSYSPIKGPNEGVAIDGTTITDIVARKAVLSVTCNPLDQVRLASIISALSKDSVEVTYFDTKTNAQRTAFFIPEIGSTKIALQTAAGVYWFTAMTVTLTEK